MLYLEFFNKQYIRHTPYTGVVTPSDLGYLKRLYMFNNDSISNYYKERNFAVKNTHILSRLLEHFPTYSQYDTFRYLEFANDKVKYLAKHFKFTSELEKGIVHPDYFFGNGGSEILIANYNPFNVTDTETNWTNQNPIRVLTHPRNDSKLLLPKGSDDGSRSGLSAVSVNVSQLALIYRQFIKQQYRNSQTEDGMVLNKNHFVIKYILPSMMRDVIDHMFLNKVMDLFYGRQEVTPKFKHRFKIFEPELQLQRYAEQTLNVITSKKLDFVNLLRNIQLVFEHDACELLSMDEIGQTRQMRWSIVASRIDYMVFLLDVAKTKDMSRHIIQDWARLAKRMLNDNGLMDLFDYEASSALKEKLLRLSEA